MCGRYYINDDTAREIEKIVRKIDGKLQGTNNFRINAGDICPSAIAPVLISARGGIDCQQFRWGVPGFDKKQLIFNARSESAMEKRMFRDSVDVPLYLQHGFMSGTRIKKKIFFINKVSLFYIWLGFMSDTRKVIVL